ncbi:MAG: PIG-L family deacetylase, partial [Thermoanaerobaculales bacterium]|nr:PIG-L family deacetylase [Thermoanaerobaculales bacterium]
MRQEAELVPYVTTRLAGSPLLVLAPHPDDEVFGCGAVLLEAVRSHAENHVVIITDGDAQGDPEARRGESREAARRMGSSEPEFWAFRDRSLLPSDPRLLDRLRRKIDEVKPELLLAPSPAEMHPDHRALALATYRVLRACPPGSLHPEFRLAAYEVSAFLRPNVLIDLTADWAQLVHAAEAFGSQNTVRPYLEVLDAVTTVHRLTLPAETTRAAAYHLSDHQFIIDNSATQWASQLGPSAGLTSDDPESAEKACSTSFFRRLKQSLGRPR